MSGNQAALEWQGRVWMASYRLVLAALHHDFCFLLLLLLVDRLVVQQGGGQQSCPPLLVTSLEEVRLCQLQFTPTCQHHWKQGNRLAAKLKVLQLMLAGVWHLFDQFCP